MVHRRSRYLRTARLELKVGVGERDPAVALQLEVGSSVPVEIRRDHGGSAHLPKAQLARRAVKADAP